MSPGRSRQRFDDLDYLYDLGDIELKMSGCMNACGHHHVGHIGILGVDKHGEEWYQITLGGSVERLHRPGRGDRAVRAAARGRRDHRAHRRGLPRDAARGRALHRHRSAASGSSRSRSAPMRRILRRRELVADAWRIWRDRRRRGGLIVPCRVARGAPHVARGRALSGCAWHRRIRSRSWRRICRAWRSSRSTFPLRARAAATPRRACCASALASRGAARRGRRGQAGSAVPHGPLRH